ncbi:MAG TPA: glycosyltransferase [Candidatus Woesebacteria bacterium]|nr:glycosyltransferase [Candidatus Woesebacteria bacterium]HNS65381.1 glycosyltransferase [Candidatus Woesebacteria bacterium]
MNKFKKSPTVSVIVTVFNEVLTIDELLKSLGDQTLKPKSIIVTDGGSTDGTLKKLHQWQQKKLSVKLEIERVNGNRSQGRNRAVEMATTELIACTDAGCVPEKTWLEELVNEQKSSGALIVAGYYQGLAADNFQVAQVPYLLVMPDKVDSSTFLPATRSMLFNRKWFLENGGFDESLSDNEDYALARKIRDIQAKSGKKILSFTKNAVVAWRPRRTLREFSWMIFRFARGDARARLWRPKVMLIFLRYFLLLCLVIATLFGRSTTLLIVSLLAASAYMLWSIAKNYRYAQSAWYWLPTLQITSDIAVMSGTIAGLVQKR